MNRWLGIVAAGLACGILPVGRAALAGGGSPSAPAGAAFTAGGATQPSWDELLERLGREDFAERQAAQHELDAVGYQQRAFLVDLAQRQTDAEVKARLLGRVDAIDEQLATDPPPISLHVTDAASDTVIYELNQAMGLNLLAVRRYPGTSYTLNRDDTPFWDVYAALSQQQALPLQWSSGSGLSINQAIRKYDRHGGFVAYASTITFSRRVDPQAAPGTDPLTRLALGCVIAADPRIKVVGASPPHLHEVVDDQGNVLLRDDTPVQGNAINTGGQQNMWSSSTILTMPANPGKKLAVIRGEGRYVVQVSQMERTIANLQAHLNEPMNIGREVVTVGGATVNAGSLAVQFTTNASSAPDGAVPVHFTVFDDNGAQMWDYTFAGNGGISTSIPGNRPGPYKLVVTVPDKTKTMVVPFELKDIPLP